MYRKIYELTEQIQEKLCACGCGTKIQSIDKYGKERFYALNHHRKNKPSPNNKGGKFVNDKYEYTYVPNHPYATKRGYVLTSRLVIEKSIGRYLTKSEVVHHIDKDPTNNKIENLKLYSSHGEHIGTEHNPKQNFDRTCSKCGSNTTGTQKKGDKYYPKWFVDKINGGFLCRTCYDSNRDWKKYKKKKKSVL